MRVSLFKKLYVHILWCDVVPHFIAFFFFFFFFFFFCGAPAYNLAFISIWCCCTAQVGSQAGASKSNRGISFFVKLFDYESFFMRILCHRPRMSRGAATGTVGRCCTRTPLMM
jgi:hypothetical protein